MITARQQLVSRLAAHIRSKERRPFGYSEWCKVIEERLSENKSEGELYDSLPNSKGKFNRLVRSVQQGF